MTVTPHRLAAIVFTDISGYTSLMGENEPKAMRVLKINQEIHHENFKKFNCIYYKQMGDGFMAVFNSLGEAVYASAQILYKTKKADIKIRIGIHEGDVIFQDNDVYGDGVNIAARLEQTSKPGCIFVSESVNRNLVNKPGISSDFVEEAKLKNVKEPIKIFQIKVDKDFLPDSLPGHETSELQSKGLRWEIIALTTIIFGFFIYFIIPYIPALNSTSINPHKVQLPGNSIAVLPFENLGIQEEYDYLGLGFADGILTKLSMLNDFVIIDRGSSFRFAKTGKSIKEIASQLGVSMILEGSYQVFNNEIRIYAKLVGVDGKRNLLTETYNGELESIFKLQDQASEGLYKLLGKTEIKSVEKNSDEYTPSLEAYKYYQEGVSNMKENYLYKSSILESRNLYHKALAADPNYVEPLIALSESFLYEIFFGYNTIYFVKDSIEKYVQQASMINPNIGQLLSLKGAISFYEFEMEEAMKLIKKGIALNPNYSFNYALLSYIYVLLVDEFNQQNAIETAIELDPLNNNYQSTKIIQSIFLSNFDIAEQMIEASLKVYPGDNMALFLKGMMLTQQKNYEKALEVMLMRSVGDTTNFLVSYLHAMVGNAQMNEKILEVLLDRESRHFVSPTMIAIAYLGQSNHDKVLEWSEKAHEIKDGFRNWLLMTMFQPMHKDHRFIAMLKKFELYEAYKILYEKDE